MFHVSEPLKGRIMMWSDVPLSIAVLTAQWCGCWIGSCKKRQEKILLYYQRVLVNTQARNDNLNKILQDRYLSLTPRFRNHRDINNGWDQKVNVIIIQKGKQEGQALTLSAGISKPNGTSNTKAEIPV